MPINKYSDTDLGALEDGLHERPTKDDFKELEARYSRRIDDIFVALSEHKTLMSEIRMDMRDMKRDRQDDFNAIDRLKARESQFESETEKRLTLIELEKNKVKWMAMGGKVVAVAIFAVAMFLGGLVFDAAKFWFSHR